MSGEAEVPSTLDIMQAVTTNDGYDPNALDASDASAAVPNAKPGKKKKKAKNKANKKRSAKSDVADADDLFRVISNPAKMLDKPRTPVNNSTKKKQNKKRGSSVHSMSSFSDYSSDNEMPSSLGLGSMASEGSIVQGMGFEDEHMSQADYDSSGGRHQYSRQKRKGDIMQEKIEMLTRISKMSKQGFAATRKWSMRDDIDEIRFECYRMTRENNSKKAVKNMQHGLITLATILEFANNMINPFNLKLQGFSRNMMLTVSDYDDSLEAIHHKWSGRTSIGPELTVLFTFATSAVFHHAGNVSSTNNPPTSREPKPAGGMGLGDMSSMLGMLSNLMPKAPSAQAAPVQPQTKAQGIVAKEATKRRPMRGPSLPSASMSLP